MNNDGSLNKLVQDQLRIESERIHKLLLQADELQSANQLLLKKLIRSKKKLEHANRTISLLTADKMHLQEKTNKLNHTLELSRVSIERNDEQHATEVKTLLKNWDFERKKYQQQIEELRKKVENQNDRDRRLWARRSFSLPPSIDNDESKKPNSDEDIYNSNKKVGRNNSSDGSGVVVLHPSVSFDAWGSDESAIRRRRSSDHASFEDAWASGGSGESHAAISSSGNIGYDFDSEKMPLKTFTTASTSTTKTSKTSRSSSSSNNSSSSRKTSEEGKLPSPTIFVNKEQPRQDNNSARPRFYSATEEEQEGATVILLDSMIQSPDFSYFDDRKVNETITSSLVASSDGLLNDSRIKTGGRIAYGSRPGTPSPSNPFRGSGSSANNSGNGTRIVTEKNVSSNDHQRPKYHNRPLSQNSNNSGNRSVLYGSENSGVGSDRRKGSGNSTTTSASGSKALTPRHRLSGSNMWAQISVAADEVAEAAIKHQKLEKDSSLSLGDDDRSLLLRLLLAPEMTLVSAILAAVPPRSKALLLNPLMRLFASHGKVARLLQWSIELEVSGTQSPSTLFRSDGTASRMLSTFTKNVGREYLHHILSPTLRIVADNADSLHRYRVSTFEVNQQTIDDFGGSHAASSDNLTKLIAQVDCVIESVVRAESRLPQSFRHLCHYLFGAVSNRFPESGHNAVGAFLFLRFVCPALAAPETFGISMPRSRSSSPAFVRRGPNGIVIPSPAERRSKVLITKLLQKVVSGIPFSERETEMFAANSFINEKHKEIKSMLMRVCVPDETYPSMEAAVAHDLARTRELGLRANEAMRTVRSLLVQNFSRIDDELPPVAFVLRRQFREALSIARNQKKKKKKKKTKDERLLEFVANDLGL
jgi:hypothetical protein